MPRGVLVDPKAAVAQEYYAGVIWDGIRKQPVMIFSDMGGIDIEEVAEKHPDHVGRGALLDAAAVHATIRPRRSIAAIGVTGTALNRLDADRRRAGAAVRRSYDLTLAEINPLGELEDGSFVALDGHIDMENEARAAPEGAARRARHRRRGDAPGARADAVRDRRRGGRRAWTTAASPATSPSSTATSAS